MNTQVYKYSKVAWMYFVVLEIINIAAFVYKGEREQIAILLLTSLVLGLLIAKMIVTEFRLEQDRVVLDGLILTTEVAYEDILQVSVSSSIDAISIYSNEGWLLADISVYYGVWKWNEMARELIQRIPPTVDVHDPFGVVGEVEQSAKWNEQTVG